MVRREPMKKSSVCRGFITGSVRAPSLLVLDWSRARPKAPFSKERVPLRSNFFRSPVSLFASQMQRLYRNSCVVGKSEVTGGRFLAEMWIDVAKSAYHHLSQSATDSLRDRKELTLGAQSQLGHRTIERRKGHVCDFSDRSRLRSVKQFAPEVLRASAEYQVR